MTDCHGEMPHAQSTIHSNTTVSNCGPWALDPTGVCKRAKMRDQTLHHCVIRRTALFELVAILPDKGFQSSGS